MFKYQQYLTCIGATATASVAGSLDWLIVVLVDGLCACVNLLFVSSYFWLKLQLQAVARVVYM